MGALFMNVRPLKHCARWFLGALAALFGALVLALILFPLFSPPAQAQAQDCPGRVITLEQERLFTSFCGRTGCMIIQTPYWAPIAGILEQLEISTDDLPHIKITPK